MCFKAAKEVVQIVQQSDVTLTGLWLGFVVRDGLNPLPQAPGVSAVTEVVSDLVAVLPFCIFDATVQVGPRSSQASLVACSEGGVSGTQ